MISAAGGVPAAASEVISMEATVLVVDDNQDIVESVAAIFEARAKDLVVVGANSGREAISLMRKRRPDIVLLDIMMPEMNGWDVASAMKQDPSLQDIPIVYLSARADELSRQMGALSAEDFIVKPFGSDDLIRRVRDVLARDKYKKNRLNILS